MNPNLPPSPRRGDDGSPYPGPDDSKGPFAHERDVYSNKKSSKGYEEAICSRARRTNWKWNWHYYILLFLLSGLLALSWVVSFRVPLRHGRGHQDELTQKHTAIVAQEVEDVEVQDVEVEVQDVAIEVQEKIKMAKVKVPFKTNNLMDEVGWDGYSLFVRGQRIFLQCVLHSFLPFFITQRPQTKFHFDIITSSGEFHTFRLPIPSLWPDILQKFTAAGLNSVSLYTHWGLLQPSPSPSIPSSSHPDTTVDFASFRALAPFYQACLDAGLWVVLRPGPYINAETTAGGIAHWATSEVSGGRLRGNGSEWMRSWRVYIQEVMRESRGWQVSEGGPIIGALNPFLLRMGRELMKCGLTGLLNL